MLQISARRMLEIIHFLEPEHVDSYLVNGVLNVDPDKIIKEVHFLTNLGETLITILNINSNTEVAFFMSELQNHKSIHLNTIQDIIDENTNIPMRQK